MTITARPYTDEQDYMAMRVLLQQCYTRSPVVYCSIGDLDWWRSAEANLETLAAQLWWDNEQLVGFAWPDDDRVDMICHPDYRRNEETMLAWAEQARIANTPDPESVSLSTWSYHGDAFRAALLERRGYHPDGFAFQYHTRPMIQPIPTVTLPDGYSIRHVRGPADIEGRVAIHQNAFAPSRMTTAYYSTAQRMPTYRMELDLVAQAPDGELAAFCIVWYDEANRMGIFEPVGCHSAHRRRGLASAVMIEGLHRLKVLGAHTAHVTTGTNNSAALHLYASLGFLPTDANERWRRELRA